MNRAGLSVEMQVPAKDVLYTCEGTWALLDDATSARIAMESSVDRSWLLVEKRGYDPICYPSDALIYRSLFPRGRRGEEA